jgi:3-hydroxy-9,10-secoandrosta-1,3,5(10)-triene-9,17-dione monooxygenase
MTRDSQGEAAGRREGVLGRVKALTAMIGDGAAAAEEARTIPREVVDALLAAGITRILIPPRYGGYGLGLDTWFEVVRTIAKADASHGWCASLMIHHPHYLGHFPKAAQETVWADGLDVAIAASIQPLGRVTPAEGGYRVSGEFPFASGINHSRRIIVGSIAGGEARFFLIGPDGFKIKDTWFTSAMRATGSNTAVCDDVYVPEEHTLALSDVREGKTPGGRLHDHPIYRAPWVSYAPLTFTAPMLGAAEGAYELFRDWTKTRRASRGGFAIAEVTSVQVRLARAAADLDAAELLLQRAVDAAQAPTPPSLALRARTMRDCSRAAELCVGVVDALIAMSGTAAFAQSHPIQRAWRDIHFAAMHVALNPEQNFSHFGRAELGLPPDPHLPFF